MRFSTRIRKFRLDRIAIGALVLGAIGLGVRGWLHENPQHNPWAPLEIAHSPGWATGQKLDALRGQTDACRAVLERGGVPFTVLDAIGDDQCRRDDRTVLSGGGFNPANPQMTCLVATGYAIWMRHGVQPAAEEILGSRVARVEHLGTYNCRRIGGGSEGQWSEHANGNALDIVAFVTEDGRRISLSGDWDGDDDEARFLRRVRNAACESFSTVLSPEYNAAHADHFHLDQADRIIGGVCR